MRRVKAAIRGFFGWLCRCRRPRFWVCKWRAVSECGRHRASGTFAATGDDYETAYADAFAYIERQISFEGDAMIGLRRPYPWEVL